MPFINQEIVYNQSGQKIKGELLEGNAVVLFAYGLSGSGSADWLKETLTVLTTVILKERRSLFLDLMPLMLQPLGSSILHHIPCGGYFQG